jgi:MoaA/NifB/PqqE/SkfB family radical SAM enzyme
MNLKRLELSLTTKCNSQCTYCQADASPQNIESMEVKDAHNYLIEAATASSLESLLVFGGEPMLYPARVTAIFKKAQALKISKLGMLTNGFWGQDEKKARKMAKQLKSAGLNILGISIDAFHFEYLPLDYPRNAAQASVKAGVKQVTWNVAVLDSIDGANHYDRLTRHLLKELEPVGIEAHIHKVVPVGRALSNIPQYFRHTSLEGPCEGEEPIGNTLTNPGSVCIEPNGSVDICWHLTIGNARQKPLSQILGEYDWKKDRIIKTLVEGGPMGLLDKCRTNKGQFDRGRYINKCHLCIEIRKGLNLRQS